MLYCLDVHVIKCVCVCVCVCNYVLINPIIWIKPILLAACTTSMSQYDKRNTNILKTLNDFNNIHPSIKFSIEKEKHKRINYLDFAIHRKNKQLEFPIYRKLIIPISSCHPYKHKLSSIKYLINRLNTYPITNKAKQIEINTIRNTLQNNEYNKTYLRNHCHNHKNKTYTKIRHIKKQNGPHLHIVGRK
jgi:hypothetical protein